MRREVVGAAAALGAVLVLVAGTLLVLLASRPSDEARPDGAPVAAPPSSRPATAAAGGPPRPSSAPMQFTREGLAGQIAQALERVTRPGRVQVAARTGNGGRWVCILADGPARYYELDQGLQPADFPWLETAGFQPAPPPVSRATVSTYRSVGRRAMGYDAAGGDRVLILLCPRDEWADLALAWPPAPSRSE